MVRKAQKRVHGVAALSIAPVSMLVYSSLLIGVLAGFLIRRIYRGGRSFERINMYVDNVLLYVVYLLIISIGLMTGVHLKKVAVGYTNVLLYIAVLSVLPTLLGFAIAVIVFKVALLKR